MRLIKPSFEIWEQAPGEIGIYKQIERAGRVCYKSEDRLTEDSYVRFVEMLKSHAHGAMLEHSATYLKVPIKEIEISHVIFDNKYSKITNDDDYLYISTNYRVLAENNCEDLLKYLSEPTEFHEKRITVHFTTDIGVSREANRHRVDSIAEQSTRYCNYSKDKFGSQIAVAVNEDIAPEEVYGSMNKWSRGDVKSAKSAFRTMCGEIYNFREDQFSIIDLWLFGNAACEFTYMELIKRGWTPQQARRVLPLDLNTELVHTAFVSDWKHFFELRCAKDAHPDIRALAIPLRDEFLKRGFIE